MSKKQIILLIIASTPILSFCLMLFGAMALANVGVPGWVGTGLAMFVLVSLVVGPVAWIWLIITFFKRPKAVQSAQSGQNKE